MRSYFILTTLILGLACSCFGQNQGVFAASDLRCEYRTDPVGIDVAEPLLFWRLESETPGQRQTAYLVLVASSHKQLDEGVGDLWDSAKEVIQIYVSDLESRVEQPLKELAGFEKVQLEPGRSKTGTIPLDQNGFKFFDAAAGKWVLEPGEFVIHAGSSSADLRLKQSIQL
jgi:hypothetical protein